MDASLIQAMHASRAAASHAVASSLAPRGATPLTAAGGAARPNAASGSSSSTSSSTDAASTITSSDFLTLLVSELQNQDPTQPVDPNAYITQLVDVNSLEQLISINSGIQSLQTAAAAASGGASGNAAAATSQVARPVSGTDPFS